MTTATATITAPHFRTQRPGDPASRAGQDLRDAYWALFSEWAEPGAETEDLALTVTHLKSATGWGYSFIEQMIFAHAMLQHLPQLRRLQEETRIMDATHLLAMQAELAELGPDVAPEVWEEFDEVLAGVFTPKRKNQETPQRNTVTKRIRAVVKRLDPTRAYDPKKRKQRVADTGDSISFDEFSSGGTVRSEVRLLTNAVKSRGIHDHLLATAREHKISLVDAALKLLTGDITPNARPTLLVYTPRDRQPGDPVFIPGSGWTGPEETVAIDELLEKIEPNILDLDAELQKETHRYTPTPSMRAAVEARDGTCVYPGCTVASQRCQLDHRIPFDAGGKTSPSNLFALCQHHHNLKTDKRAQYVQDPETGEIVWLFADGTYEISEPNGILEEMTTPTNPRWRSSLEGVMRNRAIAAEFNAKGHKILDEFDEDRDLEKAEQRIAALEDAYGMTFPIKAALPDPEPLPEEPVEPLYPDPEEFYNQNPETIASEVEAYLIEALWRARRALGDFGEAA